MKDKFFFSIIELYCFRATSIDGLDIGSNDLTNKKENLEFLHRIAYSREEREKRNFNSHVILLSFSMTLPQNNDLNGLHRLAGTDEQQEGGLILKKKTSATTSDDQHIFKVPKIPSSTSSLGLDKLAAEQRRAQSSSSSSSKRFKTDDEFHESHKNTSRNLREQRVETPSSTRSSHHDYYDRSRPVPKNTQRGLVYGKEGNKQRMSQEFQECTLSIHRFLF